MKACFFLLLSIAGLARGDCYSYFEDFNGCAYVYQCSGCTSCNCALGAMPFHDLGTTPGFLTESRDGRIVVQNVLFGSPAYSLGIMSGDELLSWNGVFVSKRALDPPEFTWGESSVKLVLARNGHPFLLDVPLVPLSRLLDKRWLGSAVGRAHRYRPFMLGFETILAGGQQLIAAVLQGGSADRAGLQVGDALVEAWSIDREGNRTGEPIDFSNIDHRAAFRLRVLRANREFRVDVMADGLSEIMRQPFPARSEITSDVETFQRTTIASGGNQ